MNASPAYRPVAERFEFVREWDDQFLQLFPHRGDYLWANHPEPDRRPEWKTESRYLLSDRTIKQGGYLYGVRFGSTTKYFVLDIDIQSYYHPQQDPFAIWEMFEALELLGLVSYVAVTSSSSGGLHLYFPFGEAQSSWAIALAAKTLLENKGFKFQGGQLEIFPNPKPYSEAQTNYNGHRLPLQQGSYLLNNSLEPIFTTQAAFVHQWQFAERKNVVSHQQIERVVHATQRQNYSKRLKVSGQKYYSDLCSDIKDGFTGSGQTQHLFAKVANRERVFYHAIHGGKPLEGKALASRIAEVVCSLPGFDNFCGHKHEIDKLAKYWARAAERRYYPYGSSKPLLSDQSIPEGSKQPTWNEQQAQGARERIKQAIADLLANNALPIQATARRNALRGYKIGNVTLDKNRDLWHPNNVNLLEDQYHPAKPDLAATDPLKPLLVNQYHPVDSNKLFPLSTSAPQVQEVDDTSSLAVGGSGGVSTNGSSELAIPGPSLIREVLAKIAARRRQVKQCACSTQFPPDENYFHQFHRHSAGDRPGQLQSALYQHPLDLSDLNSSPSASFMQHRFGPSMSPVVLRQQRVSLLKALERRLSDIQAQVSGLILTPHLGKSWAIRFFEAKVRCELGVKELAVLLQQLNQLL